MESYQKKMVFKPPGFSQKSHPFHGFFMSLPSFLSKNDLSGTRSTRSTRTTRSSLPCSLSEGAVSLSPCNWSFGASRSSAISRSWNLVKLMDFHSYVGLRHAYITNNVISRIQTWTGEKPTILGCIRPCMTWEPTIFREHMVGSERQPNTYEGFCGVVNDHGRFDYNDVYNLGLWNQPEWGYRGIFAE